MIHATSISHPNSRPRRDHQLAMRRRDFTTLLGGAVSLFFCVNAAAQEGYYGAGHDKWHQGFYSTLNSEETTEVRAAI